MSYTLAAASKAVGMNKTSVLRAIKAGKISGTRDENGQWHIEPAELHRVYPPVAERTEGNDAAQRYTASDAAALAEMRQRARQADERLVELKAMLADMTAQRDAWQRQAESSQRQVTDQRERERRSWEREQRSWRRRMVG
jgi:hypothetical protein